MIDLSLHPLAVILLVLSACAGKGEDSAPTDTDAGEDSDTNSTALTLTNAPSDGSCHMVEIHAYPEEDRHWAAERFVVPANFRLEELHYVINGPYEAGPGCNPTLLHTAELYKTSDARPDPTPVALRSFNVPAGTDTSVDRDVVLTVDPPLDVLAGEYLYLALEMQSTSDGLEYLCFQACEHTVDTPDPQTSWWSNAMDPAYDWATLASFGYNVTYNAEVSGTTE